MLHAIRIEHVRIAVDTDPGGATVLRGIGFRWKCRCGEWGRVERNILAARNDGRLHVTAPATPSRE